MTLPPTVASRRKSYVPASDPAALARPRPSRIVRPHAGRSRPPCMHVVVLLGAARRAARRASRAGGSRPRRAALAASETACRTTEVRVVAGATVDAQARLPVGHGRPAAAGAGDDDRRQAHARVARASSPRRPGGSCTRRRPPGATSSATALHGQGRAALSRRDRDPRQPRGPCAAPRPAPVRSPAPRPRRPAPRRRPRTPDDGLPDAAARPCPRSVAVDHPRLGADRRTTPARPPSTTASASSGPTASATRPGTRPRSSTRRPAGRCTFGHEHGDDPETSDIDALGRRAPRRGRLRGLRRAPVRPRRRGAERLGRRPSRRRPKRSEDHVGYKVDVAERRRAARRDGGALGVTCDYLTVVHQGSHSADALSNNAHELLYATRCDDGTQLISTTLSRFGDPGRVRALVRPGDRSRRRPTTATRRATARG